MTEPPRKLTPVDPYRAAQNIFTRMTPGALSGVSDFIGSVPPNIAARTRGAAPAATANVPPSTGGSYVPLGTGYDATNKRLPVGIGATVTGNYSTAIGYGTTAGTAAGCFALGTDNTGAGATVGGAANQIGIGTGLHDTFILGTLDVEGGGATRTALTFGYYSNPAVAPINIASGGGARPTTLNPGDVWMETTGLFYAKFVSGSLVIVGPLT